MKPAVPATLAANAAIVDLLQAAFRRLKEQHKQASLRSIALHLGLSSSFLSKVFRGERRVPVGLLGKLAKVLRLDHHEVVEIQRLLLAEVEEKRLAPSTGIRTLPREAGPSVVRDYAALGGPDLWLLERWYYLPILNLVTVKDFTAAPASVGARLGLAPEVAARALERLESAGYLHRDEDGRLVRTQLKIRFPTQRSHASVRGFHRTMIERSLPILAQVPSEQDFHERLISGITLAGAPERVAEAKVIIEEALFRAAEVLAEGPCTEVFQLNLQLFKLTR